MNWIFAKHQRQHGSILLCTLPLQDQGWGCAQVEGSPGEGHSSSVLTRTASPAAHRALGGAKGRDWLLSISRECSARSLINKITATVTLLTALALPGLVRFSPARYLVQCKTIISGNSEHLENLPGCPMSAQQGDSHLTVGCAARDREQMGPRKGQGSTKYQQSMAGLSHLSLVQEKIRSEG